MNLYALLPGVGALLAAVLTAFLIFRFSGDPSEKGRFTSIDGLRGYLAIFVFLHHSVIWFQYLRTGIWQTPDSNLFAHMGESSVALFFMITAFLFFSRVRDSNARPIDWTALFCSRVMRLAPLYAIVVGLLYAVVTWESRFSLTVPLPSLAKGMAQWMSFTILGAPDLNDVADTRYILAGVTWSLPYEWLFYLSLPILSLAFGARPRLPLIGIALAAATLILLRLELQLLAPFAGGMAASWLIKTPGFIRWARTHVATAVAAGCGIAAVAMFPSGRDFGSVALLSVTFCILAGGNSLLGALNHRVSRSLGETAYSIYLLHGLMLFFVYKYAIGTETAAHMSVAAHWTITICLTPVLVILSRASFVALESPAMRAVPGITEWIRALMRPPLQAGSNEPV